MVNRNAIEQADHQIRLVDNMSAPGARLLQDWNGSACRLSLVNTGPHPVRVSEVVAFALPIALPPDTPFYGEGYNMLSQHKDTRSRFEGMR